MNYIPRGAFRRILRSRLRSQDKVMLLGLLDAILHEPEFPGGKRLVEYVGGTDFSKEPHALRFLYQVSKLVERYAGGYRFAGEFADLNEYRERRFGRLNGEVVA